MNKEEMQDLLEIGCCIYHDRLCEKAYNYILEMQNKIDKAIEYIKENSYIVQDKEINGIPLMSKRLDKCDDLLEILGDKENE